MSDEQTLTNEEIPTIPTILTERKGEINRWLSAFIENESQIMVAKYPYSADLIPPIDRFVKRDGKRIRPALVLLAYEAFGGNELQDAYLPAIGAELMHDSFIIHDDLYDDIPGVIGTRRGEKVMHLDYESSFVDKKGAGKDSNWDVSGFARHATVASAHILLSWGAKAIYSSTFDPEKKNLAQQAYWETVEETWTGQAMDVLSKGKPISMVSVQEVLATELSRAGVYTAEYPLKLGAILAGANGNEAAILSEYARNIGLAFEIFDDVLAIYGNSSIGKMQADLAEGKRTLLIVQALELASKAQREVMENILSKRNPDSADVDIMKQILDDVGAKSFTTNILENLLERSASLLQQLSIDAKYKGHLDQFARFFVSRKS